eukprot:gene7386-13135_t
MRSSSREYTAYVVTQLQKPSSKNRSQAEEKELILIRCERNGIPTYMVLSPLGIQEFGGSNADDIKEALDKITVNLSSPSQKLWQSSQELESPGRGEETVFCKEIDSIVIIDGDNVQLPKVVFHRLVSQVSSKCHLKAEVEQLKSLCMKKLGNRGTPVSDPLNFKKLCGEAGAEKIFDYVINAMEIK